MRKLKNSERQKVSEIEKLKNSDKQKTNEIEKMNRDINDMELLTSQLFAANENQRADISVNQGLNNSQVEQLKKQNSDILKQNTDYLAQIQKLTKDLETERFSSSQLLLKLQSKEKQNAEDLTLIQKLTKDLTQQQLAGSQLSSKLQSKEDENSLLIREKAKLKESKAALETEYYTTVDDWLSKPQTKTKISPIKKIPKNLAFFGDSIDT